MQRFDSLIRFIARYPARAIAYAFVVAWMLWGIVANAEQLFMAHMPFWAWEGIGLVLLLVANGFLISEFENDRSKFVSIATLEYGTRDVANQISNSTLLVGPTGLAEFLAGIKFEKVTSINIIAHVGGITVKSICQHLGRLPRMRDERIPLRILLREPTLSDKRRADASSRTLLEIKELKAKTSWVDPEIRYYAAPAILRAIIIEYDEKIFSAYLSFYDWEAETQSVKRGAASEDAISLSRVTPASPLFSVYHSWFWHYWGRRRVHTLIFDFDDTIFFTTDARIAAWVQTINSAITDRLIARSDLSQEVRSSAGTDRLRAIITDILLLEQEEDKIAKRVFSNSISTGKLRSLLARRLEIRSELTVRSASEISSVTRYLRDLSHEYQLVIVSATSETLVRRVLARHQLDVFSFVLGREAPAQPWEDIESKTQNLLRIAILLGIPLSRIVFIGDSNSDYRSARQLGMHFVENRANAARFGRQSLIRNATDEGHFHISGDASGMELPVILAKIDAVIDWLRAE